MHHTLAWTSLQTTAVLTDMAPVPDSIIQIQNSHFVLPKDMGLWSAMAMGTNIQRARIRSPSLVQVNPAYIRPLNGGLIPLSNPNRLWLARTPYVLKGHEETIVESIQNAGVNQQITVVASLMDQYIEQPATPPYLIRITGTTTLVANAWTQISYTLETGLPVGRYAVTGAEMQSAGGQAFQLVFDNQFMRPGGYMISSLLNRAPQEQYEGWMGVWGYFDTISLPRILCLANSADTAQEGYLRVQKVA